MSWEIGADILILLPLMLGRIEDRRRRGTQDKWLDGITDSVDMSFEQTPGGGEREAWIAAVHGVTNHWT